MKSLGTRRFTLPLLAFIVGCASSAPEQKVAETPQDCQLVYRVGSNIPTRDCTPAVTEADRQRVVDEWRNSVKPMPRSSPGGGG